MLTTAPETANPPVKLAESLAELNAPADAERRPVRLLVPQVRRDDYFLSPHDTLRASDLRITRLTDDATLDRLFEEIPHTDRQKWFPGLPDELIPAELRRLRNALDTPRDIHEALAWGFTAPQEENDEEYNAQLTDEQIAAHNAKLTEQDIRDGKKLFRKKPLGWWWVYSPTRVESRAAREARYLGDTRLVDTMGFARISLRAYITIKDIKRKSARYRRMLHDPAFLREFADDLHRDVPMLSVDQLERRLRDEAEEGVLKATPIPFTRAGQSDLWRVCDAFKNSRQMSRIDEWGQFAEIRQVGRPPNPVRRRHAKATAAAATS